MAGGIQSLGPLHMSSTREFEIQRQFDFEINFPHLGTDVTLLVESCGFPTVTNSEIELIKGNSRVKVAGQATYENVDLVVKDAIILDVEAKLNEWRKLVYDPQTDKIGWVNQYKKNGTLYLFGPDGTQIRKWSIIGAWPTTLNSGENSYTSDDKRLVTMTMSVDRVVIDENRGGSADSGAATDNDAFSAMTKGVVAYA